MISRIGIGLVAVALAVSGCGSQKSDSAHAATDNTASASIDMTSVRAVRDGVNPVMYDSPADLARERKAAVVGTVQDIQAGRSATRATESRESVRLNSVVVKVKVDQVLAGAADLSGGMIYVHMDRGINLLGADGQVLGADPNPTVERLSADIAPGTRVLIVASPMNLTLPSKTYVAIDEHAGYPAGATLFDGRHPQAITFDQGDSELDEWPGLTFAEALKSFGS